MMGRIILTVTLLLFSMSAWAGLTDSEAQQLKIQCLKSFENEKTKNEVCDCMNRNLKLLVGSIQFQALIRHYKGQLSEAEKEKHDPLLLMDIEIENKCFKNPNWMAPKAQEILKSTK